jgi:hypothetical protein
MKHPAGFSVEAHMPQACEAKRAVTKKDRPAKGPGEKKA